MSLKKIITESIIRDQFKSIKEELEFIQRELHHRIIAEGVNDPGILKMIFMAGGPGSGKTYTAMELFGIDKNLKASFSSTGLKSINSDENFEKELKKNGINPKDLARIEREDPELWDMITKTPDGIREKAKKLTKLQQQFYEEGRLGMIIDGTGKDYGKIKKQKEAAEALGYDTYMVFVNTSLEVAKERNSSRDRRLPDDLVVDSWKACQENLGRFKGLFGGNFEIVDNTVYKPINAAVQKSVDGFIRKPIQNPVGKKWIETAKILKNRKFIK